MSALRKHDIAPVSHVAELVPIVLERFCLDDRMSAEQVHDSLKSIAAFQDPRSRWLAAFASPLGLAIARVGADLNTSISEIIGRLPTPRA